MDSKQANKDFFNFAADIYESVDTRRDDKVSSWLDNSLSELRKSSGGNLLDIGCGTGFVMRKAKNKYNLIIGVDISKEMLKKVKVGFPVCADIDNLPFKDGVFDSVSAIAVLHHIPHYWSMFSEVRRVLKIKGIFYSDHDLDLEFVKNFGWFVKLRRMFCDNSIGYLSRCKQITKELYDSSEVHHDGIDCNNLTWLLKQVGFSNVKVRYHWLGLSNLVNKVFMFINMKYMKRGYAPNASFWVVK